MKTTRGVIPLVAAIVGVVALGWSFIFGISAALSGSGSGPLPYTIVFFVAAVVVLAALVLAIVNLAKKRSVALSIVTVVIAALPLVTVIVSAVLTGVAVVSEG
ncbi:MAG: hypothetical protein ABL886_08600 [Rhodoglobus sp.]